MGKIEDLCTDKRGPIQQRYPAKTLKKYEADLVRVLEMVDQGHVTPSAEALCEHFFGEYNMTIAASTVRIHLSRLRRNKTLWVK